MFENVAADSVLMGVEAHADVKLTSVLIAEVTYDMVRGELKDSGDPLPRIPPQRVIGGLRYQKNAFQLGGSVQVVADQNRVFGEETPTEGNTTARFFGVVFVQQGRRAQHDHGAARQRHRQAVSQSLELPEGRAARDRAAPSSWSTPSASNTQRSEPQGLSSSCGYFSFYSPPTIL